MTMEAITIQITGKGKKFEAAWKMAERWLLATRPILMGIIFFVIIGIAIASNNKDKRR